mgnify:CR=1 FL=1
MSRAPRDIDRTAETDCGARLARHARFSPTGTIVRVTTTHAHPGREAKESWTAANCSIGLVSRPCSA